MPTTVGNEDTLTKRLQNLIALDYDAIQAYEAAIERIDDPSSKTRLAEFKADHQRHTENLGAHLREMGEEPPTEGDIKAMLTKGKVVLAGLAGDKAVLQAMKTNEEETNTAYGRAAEQDDAPEAVRKTLADNLGDEQRHREWIEQRLGEL